MRDAAEPMARCRGLGTLMVIVLLAGCTALGGGSTPTPDASGSPAATAEPSGSSTTAAPVASATSPSASPTATTTPDPEPGTLQPSALPEVEGTARYRSVLSIEEPEWGPGRVRLSYQWLRDGRAIDGATGTSYRAAAADIGRSLSVRINGRKAGYTDLSQETEAVGPVLGAKLEPATPEVDGTARVGRTLSGSVDEWGPGDVDLAWQWYRGEEKIAGATAQTYRLVAADEGQAVKLRVRGHAANFESESRYSESTPKVAPGVLDPTPVPLYSGTARVGHAVTALPREWGPGEVELAYQWYRSGDDGDVKIEGATKVKYTLVAADEGQQVKVRVSGSKAGFTTVRKYSAWTSVVDPGDLDPATPKISGAAVSGAKLTAKPGEWEPEGVKFHYQWYRSNLRITRATDDTYTVSGADVGHRITVRVTGTLDGYRDVTVTSAATGVVVARER